MTTKKASITFLAGHSPRRGVIGIPALPDSDGDTDYLARFFTYDNGTWGYAKDEYAFAPKAVTYLVNVDREYRAWWLVGRNGETSEVRRGVATLGEIPGAGTRKWRPIYGYIETIKTIDGSLYTCGGGRQVYRFNGQDWELLSSDILTEERGRGFFDIDGISARYILTVGLKGEIWLYDGKWHQDDSPVSSILTSVRVLDQDNVWICGNKGTILHGTFNRWDIVHPEVPMGNVYSVERFGDAVYLAADKGLAKVDGNVAKQVDMGLGRSMTTHRLHACDGLLWSIGEKDLAVFDGKSWTEIVHPDNS